MLANIFNFLTILLLIWILFSIFMQFIIPLKKIQNVLMLAVYTYLALLVYFISFLLPQLRIFANSVLLFAIVSLGLTAGLSFLNEKLRFPQQVRVVLKIPLIFFLVGYFMQRENLTKYVDILIYLIYFTLIVFVYRFRDTLRLPMRNLIFLTCFGTFAHFLPVELLKGISLLVTIFYLYQFINFFLVKYYFEQKIIRE